MLKEVDEDESGAIEFEEFCQIMKKKMVKKNLIKKKTTEDPKTILQKYFNDFDKNKDGFLTNEELKAIMKTIGEELTEEEVISLILFSLG
jgi:Ca2+-binding EF-hand superfamily protein